MKQAAFTGGSNDVIILDGHRFDRQEIIANRSTFTINPRINQPFSVEAMEIIRQDPELNQGVWQREPEAEMMTNPTHYLLQQRDYATLQLLMSMSETTLESSFYFSMLKQAVQDENFDDFTWILQQMSDYVPADDMEVKRQILQLHEAAAKRGRADMLMCLDRQGLHVTYLADIQSIIEILLNKSECTTEIKAYVASLAGYWQHNVSIIGDSLREDVSIIRGLINKYNHCVFVQETVHENPEYRLYAQSMYEVISHTVLAAATGELRDKLEDFLTGRCLLPLDLMRFVSDTPVDVDLLAELRNQPNGAYLRHVFDSALIDSKDIQFGNKETLLVSGDYLLPKTDLVLLNYKHRLLLKSNVVQQLQQPWSAGTAPFSYQELIDISKIKEVRPANWHGLLPRHGYVLHGIDQSIKDKLGIVLVLFFQQDFARIQLLNPSLVTVFDFSDWLKQSPELLNRVMQTCQTELAAWFALRHNPYQNAETFAQEELIYLIHPNDVIALDGYLFDVNELIDNARNGQDLEVNWHTGKKFSERALNDLNAHVAIRAYRGDEQALNTDRENTIRMNPAIVTQVIRMLRLINGIMTGLGGKEDKLDRVRQGPMTQFILFQTSLSKREQVALSQYNIHRPLIGGGRQNMRFDLALGGNGGCIFTTQIALWQFVKHFRPDEAVPEAVLRLAEEPHQGFVLRHWGEDAANGVAAEQAQPLAGGAPAPAGGAEAAVPVQLLGNLGQGSAGLLNLLILREIVLAGLTETSREDEELPGTANLYIFSDQSRRHRDDDRDPGSGPGGVSR
jgi:hypothetical protein